MHGYGRYEYNGTRNGDTYEGQWFQDMRHGQGTYYYRSGAKYVGDNVNNQKNGDGVYFWPNGDSCQGIWDMGRVTWNGSVQKSGN